MSNKLPFLIASTIACCAAATVWTTVDKVTLPEGLFTQPEPAATSITTANESPNPFDIASVTEAPSTSDAPLVSEFYVDQIEDVPVESTLLGEPTLTAQLSTATQPARVARRAAGKVVTGTLISKDNGYKGTVYNSLMTLEKAANGGDNDYIFTNVYTLGDTITATIDAAAGTVTIPCQVAQTTSIGDVKICPMQISSSSATYSTGNLVGTIDANGVVTLPAWGLLITEGDYAGRGYNFFTSSQWIPANATAHAYNIKSAAFVDYSLLIEQSNDQSLTIYGLSGITAEVINARTTKNKTVLVPNSFVYSNSYYGDFYLFPYDTETSKVTTGTNLVGTYANNAITFDAWAIAARASTSTVAYAYSDITVTPTIDIQWPTPTEFKADGEGTADSPYIITTADQIKALAEAVADGLDYEGDYFALGSDIDLSSFTATTFTPIGSSENPFNGTFDGKNYSVKNITISDYAFYELALFGYLGEKGTVKNLKVNNFRLASSGDYVAAVVARNYGTLDNINVINSQIVSYASYAGGIVAYNEAGTITNSGYHGYVTGPGCIGGIVGYAYAKNGTATISGCSTRAILTQNGYFSSTARQVGGIAGSALRTNISDCAVSGLIQDAGGYAYAGGVVGLLSTSSLISRCLSVAMISSAGNSTIGSSSGAINCYEGGLVGYAYSAAGVNDCYCSAYISQSNSSASEFAGGLVGFNSGLLTTVSGSGSVINNYTTFKNCYFSGQVVSGLSLSHKNIYGKCSEFSSYSGPQISEISFINCLYDGQVATHSGDEAGKPTSFFTNSLPETFSADVWEAQTGRYPTLKSLAGLQATELSSAPLLLADGQTASKVSKAFAITNTDNVSWSIYSNKEYVQEDDALAISGSTVTIKDQYSNEVLYSQSADGLGIRPYVLSIVPKWFDGEGTADDPFQLKSADDFVKLNTAVSTYAQSHAGDCFKVMNDIDFAESDFAGIATNSGSRMFAGTLDGNGKTIHNLSVGSIVLDDDNKTSSSLSPCFVGLFGTLAQQATVKNLTIAADCKFAGYNYVGSIAGASMGRIENCRNYAPITAAHSFSGGITAYSYTGTAPDGSDYTGAVISGCYNAGAVNSSYAYHGGIAGFNTGTIELSQNDGDVTGVSNSADTQNTAHNIIGGIAGYTNGGTIDRCVNNATITAYTNVGGITGQLYSGTVSANVNNGIVKCINEVTNRGAITGATLTSNYTYTDNYYDQSLNLNGAVQNVGKTGVTPLYTAALTSGNALEGLSSDDFDFTAGKYPVLKAFKNETASAALSSMAAYFNGTRDNISSSVKLAENVEWSLTVNDKFTIADNTLSLAEAGMAVVNDTLTASAAGLVKVIPVRYIPTIFEGEGTAESPYLISTPKEWNDLAEFMATNQFEYSGEYFRLTNDLDFEGDSIKVVAVNGVKFDGIFDGNGKTIKNYVYNNTNSTTVVAKWVGPNLYRGAEIGIFGTLGENGVIKNLTTDGDFKGCTLIGGIVGQVYGTVQNCVHKGKLETTSGTNASGIANKVFAGGKIIDCVNEGSVTTKTTGANGIAYTVLADGLIENCVNNGTVKATTNNANGIVYSSYGTVRNCANHATLQSASGILSGICYTLYATGVLENCYNDADLEIGSAGANVCGVVYTTSDMTTEFDDESQRVATSWLKGCYNTGNLSAKSGVYGVANTIKKGTLVEDCYNTGNVTATDTYNAFGFAGAITTNTKDTQVRTTIRRCWNGGNVTAQTSSTTAVAGFAKSATSGLYTFEDCYNLGDVTLVNAATASGHVCVATGFIGQITGDYTRCWNAGNVTAQAPQVAGLCGYIAAGSYPASMTDCFNLGNISGSNLLSTGSAGSVNGTAAGLIGYTSTNTKGMTIRNCFNAGDVTGNTIVGGLIANVAAIPPTIENCYNSGKVTCSDGLWSGAIYSKNATNTVSKVEYGVFDNTKNVYYDSDITTGTEGRTFEGSAKSTLDMRTIDLGDAYNYWHTYPVLKSFSGDDENAAANDAYMIGTAMVAVAEGDTYNSVSNVVTLAAAPYVKWSAEGEGQLEIIGAAAYPRKTGKVTLTAANADGSISRSWELTINDVVTGIDDLQADGKTIVKAIYVDMAGRIIAAPVAGQPYVVKVTYDDGTSAVRKVVARD